MKNPISQNGSQIKYEVSLVQVIVRLHTDKYIRNSGGQVVGGEDLRDAINRLFPNNALLHKHLENGQSDFSYPLVQYKIINGKCYLVGFKKGAALISDLDMVGKIISLKGEKYRIVKRDVIYESPSLTFSDTLQRYRFLTPWLPLDQENYEEYLTLDMLQRRLKLDSIIRGNIIETAKGLEVWLNQHIYALFMASKKISSVFKDQKMITFYGTLVTNVILPDYIGIGKAKSHGFGTIKRIL